MSRIGTKSSDDEKRELIQEAVKQTTESFKKILEEPVSEKGKSRVSQILASVGKQSIDDPEKEKENLRKELEEDKKKIRMEVDREKEGLQKKIEESEVFCPTCSGAKKENISQTRSDMNCSAPDTLSEYDQAACYGWDIVMWLSICSGLALGIIIIGAKVIGG